MHSRTQVNQPPEEIPGGSHTAVWPVRTRRYHTQLCTDAAKCSRHICFFAHSSVELREPTQECNLPEDVRSIAELAVWAEEARQNMVLGKRGASAARTSAVGKAVALAVMDRPAQQQSRQQAPINQAQNMLLANTVAGDLLSSLLADLHQEQHQQPKLQASSRGPIAGAKQDHWTPPQSQPGRVRRLSVEASAAERQELARRSLSEAAADPRFGARFCGKLAQGLGLDARPGYNRPMSVPHPLLSPPVSNSTMLAFQSALYETTQGVSPQHQPAAGTHEGYDAGGFLHTDASSNERRASLELYRPFTNEECLQLASTLPSSDAWMALEGQLQYNTGGLGRTDDTPGRASMDALPLDSFYHLPT